ncbi:unnamed protein product [Lota lota]
MGLASPSLSSVTIVAAEAVWSCCQDTPATVVAARRAHIPLRRSDQENRSPLTSSWSEQRGGATRSWSQLLGS